MSFKDKVCVVTGGAGFIGSNIVDLLLKDGAKVRVIDNLITGLKSNLKDGAEFIDYDIRELDKLYSCFDGADYVFHTAAIARTPWTVDDPILSHEINATGTLNVLEACRKCNVSRMVHSSSYILYAPNTPYYVSKLCAEEYVRIYSELYDLSTISLRYSNVYGKGQNESGPHPNLAASLRKSKKEKGRLWITGDGTQKRDYVHVDDVAQANIMAALSSYNGRVDICTGVMTALNDFVKVFDCPIDYVEDRVWDAKCLAADPVPAKEILGWESKISLTDGIVDIL